MSMMAFKVAPAISGRLPATNSLRAVSICGQSDHVVVTGTYTSYTNPCMHRKGGWGRGWLRLEGLRSVAHLQALRAHGVLLVVLLGF